MSARGASQAAAAANVGAAFMQLIEQIGRERGIEVDILVEALEDAITTASRKQQERAVAATRQGERPPGQEILVCRLNRATGELELHARKEIVDKVDDEATEIALTDALADDPNAELGGHVEQARSTKGLGRIEAQAAKQVIFQKVREAERDQTYHQYRSKIGQLVNATVKRFERGDVVLELGQTEAILPRRHQSRAEIYSQSDRVRAVIVEVTRLGKGPQVVVSRNDPSLIIRLFEMEVPEIYDGTVLLKHAVREPGERAKIAVASAQRDVDPVGACVGLKGSRVQAIIRELRGEKIDIVQWSDDITTFAAHALNPAKVSRVLTGSRERSSRSLEVVVDDQQLSLAIGKKGQNVRLAAKLVGWRIDITSENEKRRDVEREMTDMARRATAMSEVPGVSETDAQALAAASVGTVDELLRMPLERLAEAPSIDETIASRLRAAAQQFLGGAHVEQDSAGPSEGAAAEPTAES